MEPRVSAPRRTSEREIKPLERSYPTDKLTGVSLRKARFSATRRRLWIHLRAALPPPGQPRQIEEGRAWSEAPRLRDSVSRARFAFTFVSASLLSEYIRVVLIPNSVIMVKMRVIQEVFCN